ncbi:MAG: hypothetical protein EOL89_01190 [Actinobacteria bacterium]|nr:hypothetical protein [Actinomycetota bacterium]
MELLDALIVLVGIGVVFGIMFRGVRRLRSGAGTGIDSAGSRGGVTAFLVGLVAALAVAQLAVGGASPTPLSTVGFGVGLLAALLTVPGGLSPIIEWGFSVIGAVAAIPAIAVLVRGSDCPGAEVVPWAGRLATAVLLVFCIVLGAGFAFGLGELKPLAGLAWFGAIEVLSFLQTPGGVDLFSAGEWALAASIAAAIILGFLASKHPELVLGTAGASMVVAQAGLVDAGLGCAAPAGSGAAALGFVLAPFLVAFVAMKLVAGWLRR